MDQTIRANTGKNKDLERDNKTIRPDINKSEEATMRPNPVSRKEVSQDSKTMRPTGKGILKKTMDATMRPNHDKTSRKEEQQAEIDNIIQTTQNEFNLKGKIYNVVEIISQQTGEAQIYLVENNGDKYVLKLYFLNIQPPPNMQIIGKIKNIAESELLINIFDCGEWVNPQTSEVRQYELMEYCDGGSLEKININKNEELLCEIALQCASAINFLNSKNVIHRDVKPSNFFYKTSKKHTEDLRLADFGISVQTNDEGKAIIKYQLRTKIYAAPEYYVSIDEEIEIDYMSDFYSLGIMLIVLWNGEDIFKINELELVRLKIDGKLPYPEDISDRTLQLLKALTVVNPRARAGYKDIIRWAKGENIYDLRKESNEGFNIIFDATDNQIAESPEELGLFMCGKKELAVKYLYSGKIAEWLTANKRPELAIEMEDIVENQYPKNKEAGLLAACYLLDKSIPYKDLQNNELDNIEAIAKSLRDNFEYYSEVLANKNDSLFVFFNTHGLSNITNEFASLFKKKNNNYEALLRLIYTLNPNAPWILSTEDGDEIECNTPDDIITTVYEKMLDDNSWYGLTEESFLIWVRNIDPSIEGKIRSQKGYDENPWCVIYNLNPKLSYTLNLDENSEVRYFFTAAQVADYMDTQMIFFLHEKDEIIQSNASEELDMLCDIEDTRLYYYLKSKGVYDDKIEWIKYCSDMESEENANKYSPYNWKTGVYKSIKGLGCDPSYFFPKSDKYISSLDELDDISKNEIKEEIENGALKEWIAIFFQENPDADLSQKYSFENLTVDYLEFISQYKVNDIETSEYFDKSNQVQKTANKLRKHYKSNLFIKILLGSIATIAVGIVSYKLITMNLEFMSNSKWLYIIPLIIGYIVGRYRWGECFDSFIKSFLIGLGVFVALSIIILVSMSFPTYILAGLLVAGFIYTVIVCYIKPKLGLKGNKDLLNPGFEELHLEPLHYAFVAGENEEFRSSIGDRSINLIDKFKANTKKVIKLTMLLVISSVLVFFLTTYLSNYKVKKQKETSKYEALKGEYKGNFDNKVATFKINDVSLKNADANIKVRYKNMIDEKLNGSINIESRTFHFDDVNQNNNLDGEYNGTFNEDFTEMTGTYSNYKTKKKVEFKFNK